MNNCIDCRIEISKKAKRCLSCRGKSQQVKYLCQDCGCEVSRSGLKRCIGCEYKSRVGEGNSHFKDGYTLIDKKCMDCGKSICSTSTRCLQCYGKLHSKNISGENHPQWIDGRSFEKYPQEFNDRLRLEIRTRDNFQCQNCGMTEEEHLIVLGRVLEIHHIDYNKKNCIQINLITTCRWCNIRANINRSYWQNYYTEKIQLICQ